MLQILYAQGFASNTYVFGFGFIVVNRFYDSCFLSHFYNSICELNYSMLFSLLGFFAVKTVVVCSSCWLNTLILFYCRIIFVMCCSFFLLLLFRTRRSNVGFDYTVLPDCFNIDFPSKYSYASKPALNACVPINSFIFRLCSYLISSRVVTFVHSFDSYS